MRANLLAIASLLLLLSPPSLGQCLQWQQHLGTDDKIFSLATYDDGSGPALFAGGHFTHIGGVAANRIAKWSGSAWQALGPGIGNNVYAIAGFDDGSGPAIYAVGAFIDAGGAPAAGIAKWDGSTWSEVAGGLSGGDVRALTVFDDGTGPALFAAGTLYGGAGPMRSIAKLTASGWTPLGAGIMDSSVTSTVYCLAVFDDGSGPALFAGGLFDTAGGLAAHNIAKWDGQAWHALGSGTNGTVLALASLDDGSGPGLYVGGEFTQAGSDVFTIHIAKWTGTSWGHLDTGLTIGSPSPTDHVSSLAVFDAGDGPHLYAGGVFTESSGPINVGRWSAGSWSALSGGTNGDVRAMIGFQDGTNTAPDLYVGGEFTNAGGTFSPYLAEWLGCPTPGVGFCFGDGTGAACPCDPGQIGSPGSGCMNSFGLGGVLEAMGHASVANDSVTLVAYHLPNSAIGLFFQGTVPQAGSLGSPFGDGLLCVNGTIRRLGIRSASSGTVSRGYGVMGDSLISLAGAIPPVGGTRHYQLWYRDPPVFCTPSTFNLTNGLRIDWQP